MGGGLRLLTADYPLNDPTYNKNAHSSQRGFLTSFGTEILAVGGNREAARVSGIKVDHIKILTYTTMGLMLGYKAVPIKYFHL